MINSACIGASRHAGAEKRARQQLGMTLIEVLVAAIVMGFGLLGVAALQLSTSKISTESLSRSQVVMLAEFIADRIRANTAGAASYDGLSCDASGCNRTTTATCDTSSCSSSEIAAKDAEQWQEELAGSASHLSAVTGTLALDANNIWTIRIFWNDSRMYGEDALNRHSASDLNCTPQSVSNKDSLQCYQIRLVP
ncbi:type IV pilus modification protein PilV [Thiorhodococcus minor]|uniref:Type IV pilus modification protein PilV n=1 Tax=Thiorhodococcus minor TaxID=57489 RepID=A0A6M0JZR5_9GAMM|nr:type IV pilus modification protein PilV [Thiorhodococcus minor]